MSRWERRAWRTNERIDWSGRLRREVRADRIDIGSISLREYLEALRLRRYSFSRLGSPPSGGCDELFRHRALCGLHLSLDGRHREKSIVPADSLLPDARLDFLHHDGSLP